MSASPRSVSQTTAPRSGIARRALLGFGILAAATGGAASLLYGSIEADADFTLEPETRQRRAMLAGVADWDRTQSLETVRAQASATVTAMHVLPGPAMVQLRRSAAQKLVEDLQTASGGPSRLVLASVHVGSGEAADGFSSVRSSLDALVARGLDGVFLDCSEVYAAARPRGPAVVDELAAGIAGVVAVVRQVNPNFLVIIENAAELTASQPLARIIDGVARDDLLFGQEGMGMANKRTEVIAALHDLNRVKRTGRPVFVSERLPADAATIRIGAQQTLRSLGFVARFATPPG